MAGFNERTTVENYLLEKLTERGWTYVRGAELEREDNTEPLLVANLEKAVRRLNGDADLEQEEIEEVVNKLKLRSSGYESLREILRFLKDGVPLKRRGDNSLRYVKLIDYRNRGSNEFIVSNQVFFEGGKENIIPDIVLYVNGIPLVIIECKNPVDPSVDWYNAYRDIKDYEKLFPELFKYCQFGIAAEQTARYFPIVPWMDETHIYEWKSGVADPVVATLEMLGKDTLLDLVRNYIFFREERGKATRVMARYMQYRAAEKIFARVMDNLGGKDDKKRGLIWHWQGSGKTLTMIFAANKLYRQEEMENPTVFFIVDRVGLEDQLNQEFASLDITKPEVISSIRKLKSVLLHDEGRGKRGIMITLVHKFKPAELEALVKEMEASDKEKKTFLSRKNIAAFVDEGHRTQYGVLAAQMKSVLRNSFFFAFTGTPIAVKGKDTYQEFSYPKEGERYLDRYFITESIVDGYTVKIVYQPRLEKDVHLKKELLEEFLNQDLEEIPESLKEEVEDRLKQKLNQVKVFLKNPERIKRVAKDIAGQFLENTDGKFKAMVVAVDRGACVAYKRELDKLLPKEYSDVVMTFNQKEGKEIRAYRDELEKKYKSDDLDRIRKEIIAKFKDEEYPRILIVTEMLLTGFDAPKLQVMYLDKPLKDHRLLQAMARTNRPLGELKENGLIIDYVGVFEKIQKAFGRYAKDDLAGAVWDMDAVAKEFTGLISGLGALFANVSKRNYDRNTLLQACDVLTRDDSKAEEFVRGYKKLRRIFELLGSETIKLEYLNAYRWLTAIYVFYNRMVKRQDPDMVERYAMKYFDKTVADIYKSTEVEKIRNDLPLISFDESYLKNLEEKFRGKEERAANIVFTLNRFVLVEKHKNPLYETLIEKVERLVQEWKDRQRNLEEIYSEGRKLVQKIQEMSSRQKKLGVSNLEYAVLVSLEEIRGGEDDNLKAAKSLIGGIKPELYKGWKLKASGRKSVGQSVRIFLMGMGLKKREREELYSKIMRGLEYYA